MSGSLTLIGEILAFMGLATFVGFAIGRLSGRGRPKLNVAELTALRERTSLLEREVDELTAALTEARLTADAGADAAALQSKLAMAEREAEGLDRRLQEAVQRIADLEDERDELRDAAAVAADDGTPVGAGHHGSDADDQDAIDPAELEALREELARRTEMINRLERVAADANRLQNEIAVRDDRIGRLEAALEANAANRAVAEGDAASIGMSVGAGNYADSRLEFEAYDPPDEA